MALTWALPTGAARSWDPTGSANLCKMQLQLSAFLICNFCIFILHQTGVITDTAAQPALSVLDPQHVPGTGMEM